jgi:hypothetical protein
MKKRYLDKVNPPAALENADKDTQKEKRLRIELQ